MPAAGLRVLLPDGRRSGPVGGPHVFLIRSLGQDGVPDGANYTRVPEEAPGHRRQATSAV